VTEPNDAEEDRNQTRASGPIDVDARGIANRRSLPRNLAFK